MHDSRIYPAAFLERATHKDMQPCMHVISLSIHHRLEGHTAENLSNVALWQWFNCGYELHINTNFYFPAHKQPWWTTGQTEAVQCGDLSQATAHRLPAHLLCLDCVSVQHRSGEIGPTWKHAHTRTHSHSTVYCLNVSSYLKEPHAATAMIYSAECVQHLQKQQW